MELDIKHIANLAKLPLTEEEETELRPQLLKIIQFIEKLKELDTANVDITYQVTGKVNELRSDESASEPLKQEDVLSNAPNSDGDYIVTKGVLGNR